LVGSNPPSSAETGTGEGGPTPAHLDLVGVGSGWTWPGDVAADNRNESVDSTIHLCSGAVEGSDPDRTHGPIDLVRALVEK